MYRGEAISYYSVDGLGSAVLLNDPTGTVQNAYLYDAWGEVKGQSGTLANDFGYTAREFGEAGMWYYRARYYQPSIGRFGSEDPIRFGGGVNFFAYVRDNPLAFVDPYGLECMWRKMLVTAYCDKGPGSDWAYYKRKGGVGPGTGASANIGLPGKPAIPQYPYGCDFTVFSDRGDDPFRPIEPTYTGEFHDTGAGMRDSKHHNVPSPDWMDIWLPCGPARKWGKQWLWVKICCDECPDV